MLVNLNTRMTRSVMLFTGYVLNYAKSNTDGAGAYPANEYDLSTEYGRSSLDTRHRFFLGGSVSTKWNLRLSPFIIAHSGTPFNIYTGRDLNGDLIINDRPAFATASQLGQPGIVSTPLGHLQYQPRARTTRSFRATTAWVPAYFSVNLRVSRTFGFGPSREQQAGSSGWRIRRSRRRWSAGRGGGPGGMRMGGGGRGGMFGDSATSKRYNLVVSINARNLFNNVNQRSVQRQSGSSFFGAVELARRRLRPARQRGYQSPHRPQPAVLVLNHRKAALSSTRAAAFSCLQGIDIVLARRYA